MRERLKVDYWNTFRISAGRHARIQAPQDRNQPIVEEAQSFRGGSPFECGIIDESALANLQGPRDSLSKEEMKDKVKRYDLMMLAANADLTWLEAEEFARIAKANGAGLSAADVEEIDGVVPVARHGRPNART